MEERELSAEKIVDRYALYAAGAGLVPIPLVDIAAVTGIQVVMIKTLSETYGVEFREDRVRQILGALVGGGATGLLAGSHVAASMLRAVPLIGQTVVALRLSIYGGAVTYGVGKVFAQHYASGGTLLTFDLESARTALGDQIEKGKSLLRRKAPTTAPA